MTKITIMQEESTIEFVVRDARPDIRNRLTNLMRGLDYYMELAGDNDELIYISTYTAQHSIILIEDLTPQNDS